MYVNSFVSRILLQSCVLELSALLVCLYKLHSKLNIHSVDRDHIKEGTLYLVAILPTNTPPA